MAGLAPSPSTGSLPCTSAPLPRPARRGRRRWGSEAPRTRGPARRQGAHPNTTRWCPPSRRHLTPLVGPRPAPRCPRAGYFLPKHRCPDGQAARNSTPPTAACSGLAPPHHGHACFTGHVIVHPAALCCHRIRTLCGRRPWRAGGPREPIGFVSPQGAPPFSWLLLCARTSVPALGSPESTNNYASYPYCWML